MTKITTLPSYTAPTAADILPIVDNTNVITKHVTMSDIAALVKSIIMPSGLVQQFAGSSAPSGWLICDGSAISRTTYATLFAAIGTTYGTGDGSTTFNIPDGRGKVIAGYLSGDTNFGTLGAAIGATTTRHAFLSPPLNSSNFQDGGAAYLTSANGDINTYLTGGGSSSASRVVNVRSVGGTIGTNSTVATEVGHYEYTAPNLQPSVTMTIIIKT